ncbi:MAG TPA: M28 family peptidase [Flavobacteriales bacterium]|nr:M28 family peptidase [Flavobacteriales bacterium]
MYASFSRALAATAVLALATTAQAQHPVVQNIIAGVSVDSLVWELERLSGEEPVNVGNGDQLILSRNKNNAGNALAADWLQQRFAALGYTPRVQLFGSTGENIIATKPGVVHPERKVVICGHYDAMPGGPVNAPAADDDGSGSAAVLEAARLMAPYTFENTIVFALWDEEEQGLVGSHYYAGAQAASDSQIVATVNMDAIAYDGDGDGLLRIHTRPVANSIALKDTALMVNTTYGLDLNIAVNNPGATYSDHAAFWSEGYSAILVIEDFDNDGNPHYHTPTDLIEYMDLEYWRDLARLSLGTAAVMAIPFDESTGIVAAPLVRESERLNVFPNPCAASATVRCAVEDGRSVRVSLTDATGREVRVLHEGGLSAGSHTFTMDMSGLPAGAYVVRMAGSGSARALRLLHLP